MAKKIGDRVSSARDRLAKMGFGGRLLQRPEKNAPTEFTPEDIEHAISKTADTLGSDFCSGDCGNFAIALAEILGENASFEVVAGSDPEMYDHVAVKFEGNSTMGPAKRPFPAQGPKNTTKSTKRITGWSVFL